MSLLLSAISLLLNATLHREHFHVFPSLHSFVIGLYYHEYFLFMNLVCYLPDNFVFSTLLSDVLFV